jgi:hypothetical protein
MGVSEWMEMLAEVVGEERAEQRRMSEVVIL